MTYSPPFVATTPITNLCMEIAEMVGKVHPASPLITSLTLHRKLRIQTIYSSLTIEGNQLTPEAVTAVLDGQKVLGPAQDIREVENARRAYALLPELDPFSVVDLLRAHGALMEGLIWRPGAFREGNFGVFEGDTRIHTGTPTKVVPDLVQQLFDWLRLTDVHPLLASCIFHYEFEFIHPFSDGNGRTGRLWHTLLLANWRPAFAWLPVENVVLQRRAEYYGALAASNAAGSCETFVHFMLESIRDALLPFVDGNGFNSEQSDDAARSGPAATGESQQSRALRYFAEDAARTVDGLASELGLSKRSAERLVAALRSDGRLVREGSPRAGQWIVPAR